MFSSLCRDTPGCRSSTQPSGLLTCIQTPGSFTRTRPGDRVAASPVLIPVASFLVYASPLFVILGLQVCSRVTWSCGQPLASGSASCSAARWRSLLEGAMEGLGGCRMASCPGVLQAAKGSLRPPQQGSSLAVLRACRFFSAARNACPCASRSRIQAVISPNSLPCARRG